MNYDYEYQTLWNALDANAAAKGLAHKQATKAGIAFASNVFDALRNETVQRMVILCQDAVGHYSATDDAYRLAMWRRRHALHQKGQTDGVWDGRDEIAAQRATGKGGDVAAMAAMRAKRRTA